MEEVEFFYYGLGVGTEEFAKISNEMNIPVQDDNVLAMGLGLIQDQQLPAYRADQIVEIAMRGGSELRRLLRAIILRINQITLENNPRPLPVALPEFQDKSQVVNYYFHVGLNHLGHLNFDKLENILLKKGFTYGSATEITATIGLVESQVDPQANIGDILYVVVNGDWNTIVKLLRWASNQLNQEIAEPTTKRRALSPEVRSGIMIYPELDRVIGIYDLRGYIYLTEAQVKTIEKLMDDDDARIIIAGIGILSEYAAESADYSRLLEQIMEGVDQGRRSILQYRLPEVYRILEEEVEGRIVHLTDLTGEIEEIDESEYTSPADRLANIIDEYYRVGADAISPQSYQTLTRTLNNDDLEVILSTIGWISTRHDQQLAYDILRMIVRNYQVSYLVEISQQFLEGGMKEDELEELVNSVKPSDIENIHQLTGLSLLAYYNNRRNRH